MACVRIHTPIKDVMERTFSHCFSTPDSMDSLTIFVWMGTQVSLSNAYHDPPPYWCLVYIEKTIRGKNRSTLTADLQLLLSQRGRIRFGRQIPLLCLNEALTNNISQQKGDILTVSRLVGNNMARNEGLVRAETMRTFMNCQIGTNAMTSSVLDGEKQHHIS